MNKTIAQESRVRSMVCMLMMFAVSSSMALAQSDTLRPPKTDAESSGGGFMVLVVALLLVALVVVTGILKSKRSHQD